MEIGLTEGGTIRGRIEGIPEGARARVDARCEALGRSVTVTPDGTFEIGGLTPEVWTLRAVAGSRSASAEARPGETVTLVLK
jgi:hypothetical protein